MFFDWLCAGGRKLRKGKPGGWIQQLNE